MSSHAGTTFYLNIRDIREEDQGQYMCQINTVPMKSQIGFLRVVGMTYNSIICLSLVDVSCLIISVPPRFVEKYTSSDEEVREDSSVSLRCSANGLPKPEIKWRREDEQPFDMNSNSSSHSDQKGFNHSINSFYYKFIKN